MGKKKKTSDSAGDIADLGRSDRLDQAPDAEREALEALSGIGDDDEADEADDSEEPEEPESDHRNELAQRHDAPDLTEPRTPDAPRLTDPPTQTPPHPPASHKNKPSNGEQTGDRPQSKSTSPKAASPQSASSKPASNNGEKPNPRLRPQPGPNAPPAFQDDNEEDTLAALASLDTGTDVVGALGNDFDAEPVSGTDALESAPPDKNRGGRTKSRHRHGDSSSRGAKPTDRSSAGGSAGRKKSASTHPAPAKRSHAHVSDVGAELAQSLKRPPTPSPTKAPQAVAGSHRGRARQRPAGRLAVLNALFYFLAVAALAVGIASLVTGGIDPQLEKGVLYGALTVTFFVAGEMTRQARQYARESTIR